MNRPVSPHKIRADLGLVEPPFHVRSYADYLGVELAFSDVSAARTVYDLNTGQTKAVLPHGKKPEFTRQQGAHELGHVANGDVGPNQPVLYARGPMRGAWGVSPVMEAGADTWALEALVPVGPLRLAIKHHEIRWVGRLASMFWVYPRFIVQAAVRYGLDALLLRDPEKYRRYLHSDWWIGWSNVQLASRRVCERSLCDAPSVLLHHLRYDTLGRERPGDVEALCQGCLDGIEFGNLGLGQLPLFE